jgi:V8-like Glu-specific endopeptidase
MPRHSGSSTIVVLSFLVGLALVPPLSAGKALPPRPELASVGETVVVELVPRLDASAAGDVVWTHELALPGASFVKPHFVDFNLKSGDRLIVRAANGRVVEVLEGRGLRDRGTFWGLSAPGSSLFLELRAQHLYREPPFRVDRVVAGRADLFDPGPTASRTVCGAPDYQDTLCYESDALKWPTMRASGGVLLADGEPGNALFCSGSIVSPLGYFLTNHHCIPDQSACDNSEILFDYRRTGCNDGSPPTQDWQSFHCDQLVVTSPFDNCEPSPQQLDFSLVSILGDPVSAFGTVRPDPAPLTDGEAVYIVQHPSGRPQEVALGSGEDFDVDTNALRYFGTLDTEPGSSGSPILRQSDGKLIGLHHCGSCKGAFGNRGVLMSDIYPAIAPFLCTQSLSLLGIRGSALAEVEGNGDAKLDPGETWQLTPQLRNASCGVTATGITARIGLAAGAPAGITLLDTSVALPSLAPGEAGTAAPIRFVLGPGTACGSAVAFDLLDVASDGGQTFPATLGLATATVGERYRARLFYESFAAGLPGAWTVVDGGTGTGPASTWTTTNPGDRMVPSAEPFAIADSDEHEIGMLMDEQLISPVVDARGFSGLELQFTHDFNWYELGFEEIGDVDVRSTATGGAWVNVASYQGADFDGTETFDLSAFAAGRPDVQVRFHYHNARFEWWWAVDDVYLLGNNGYRCQVFDPATSIFDDGFETGDLSAWSTAVGGP